MKTTKQDNEMATREEISEMIAKYSITRQGDNLAIYNRPKTAAEVEVIRAAKPEILAELIRREEESAAKEAAKVEEARAIRAGEIVIRPQWHDGEILSGWEVFGQAADALEEIGVAKYISGWGHIVEQATIDALGKEFTFPQAAELTRRAREEKEAAARAKAEERLAKFDEAKRTGKRVELRSWMDDCNDPREQCSLDHVTEYAMPDGTTKIVRQHTW
jgi:hypothetical protein